MSPDNTLFDFAHQCITDAERLGDDEVGFARINAAANLHHIGFSEFRGRILRALLARAAMFARSPQIFWSRDILQIVDVVVTSTAIFVVNVVSGWSGSYITSRHHAVNESARWLRTLHFSPFFKRSSIEFERFVSVGSCMWAQFSKNAAIRSHEITRKVWMLSNLHCSQLQWVGA